MNIYQINSKIILCCLSIFLRFENSYKEIYYELNCPMLIYQFEEISCNLTFNSSGRYSKVNVDFGDQELRSLNVSDGTMILKKKFNRSGNFTIISKILGSILYNTLRIKVIDVDPKIDSTGIF